MSTNQQHYCSCLTAGALTAEDKKRLSGHKAALLLSAKWSVGSVITLRFLEGAPELRQRVQAVAEEWTKLANLSLDFRNSGATDIRIAFMEGRGSWSYLGAMCRQIPEPQPTMNYGWLTPDSGDDELRRVVLHEFGHALGMMEASSGTATPSSRTSPARPTAGAPRRSRTTCSKSTKAPKSPRPAWTPSQS
jgi:serralysin